MLDRGHALREVVQVWNLRVCRGFWSIVAMILQMIFDSRSTAYVLYFVRALGGQLL